MSSIQKMQKDWDTKRLKHQLSGLKVTEERLTDKLEPLQEEVMVLSQTITDKKIELKALVEQMETKLNEPLSEQVVAKMQEREDEVQRSVAASKERYDQLVQFVKEVKASG